MAVIRWSDEKNRWLLANRGVCFEQVLLCFECGDVLDVLEHPNAAKCPNQEVAVVAINGYAHLVPYVRDGEDIFLKTIIPSRKATAKYLKD